MLPIEVTLHADKTITIRDRAEFEDEREIRRADLPRIIKEKQNKAPDQPVVIERGMRIAQLVLAKVEQLQWQVVAALDQTARGAGGFGSTGVKS